MFCIKIAGLSIGIDNKYDLVLRVCRDYICREIPVFSVSAEEDEIDYEISLAQREVSRAYAESICIYRKIGLSPFIILALSPKYLSQSEV